MAKKIKFPLEMADDAKVSSLDELQEHFDLESVLNYYSSGRLTEWLEDRYYDDEADKISALDSNAADFNQRLCEALGIEYVAHEANDLDLWDIAAKQERLERLKVITSDAKILASADRVAFTQEDLADLLDSDVKEIYLCGGPFKIPKRVENVTYIGVNNPKANAPDGFGERGIVFKNVDSSPIDSGNSVLNPIGLSDIRLSIDEIIQQAIDAPHDVDATIWLNAAELGSAKAQYTVGTRYYSGDSNVEQSYDKAIIWYRKAAEQGDADAQDALCSCYFECFFEKYVIAEDNEETVEWFRKAAEQGYAYAQALLGDLYSSGLFIARDDEEALKWYHKAVEQGYAEAQDTLGDCYYRGQCVEQDFEAAVGWYRKAAEQGHAGAQDHLGDCYYYGHGVDRDYKKAVVWFRKAVKQDNVAAQCNLGVCYYMGNGVEENEKEAVKWFSKAAERRYAAAQYFLGLCYWKGTGIEQNFEVAVKWYRKAAEQDIADAQYALGLCCYAGKGVDRNYKEAVEWFRKAAEQDIADAQYDLGRCYYFGRGVETDHDKAVKWFQQASAHGNNKAKVSLVTMNIIDDIADSVVDVVANKIASKLGGFFSEL